MLRTVTPAESVVAAEYVTLRQSFEGVLINGGGLAFAVWHLGNLITQATGGRYALVLQRQGVEVPATDLREPGVIEPVRVEG